MLNRYLWDFETWATSLKKGRVTKFLMDLNLEVWNYVTETTLFMHWFRMVSSDHFILRCENKSGDRLGVAVICGLWGCYGSRGGRVQRVCPAG